MESKQTKDCCWWTSDGDTYFYEPGAGLLDGRVMWAIKLVCWRLLVDLWFWSGTDRLPRPPFIPDDSGGGNAVLQGAGDLDGCSAVHGSHWPLVSWMHYCRAAGPTGSLSSQQPSTAGSLALLLSTSLPPCPSINGHFPLESGLARSPELSSPLIPANTFENKCQWFL